MKIKTLIFFFDVPFSFKDYKRCGIDVLIKLGYQIQIWDNSYYKYFEWFERSGEKIFTNDNQIVHCQFKNKYELIEGIHNVKNDSIIIFTQHYNIGLNNVYRMLSKNGILYGFLSNNTIPQVRENELNIGWGIRQFIRKLYHPIDFFNVLFRKIPHFLLGVDPPNFIICGGNKSLNKKIAKSTNIIWAHSSDYDDFLSSNKKSVYYKKKKYAVFLDEFGPFHPDLKYSDSQQKINEEIYYIQLEEFFTSLEKYFNINIVVAAHPFSEYEKMDETYSKERKIIKNQTVDLVKNSYFVLAHASTSISFAVLWYKPIIFVIVENAFNKFYKKNIIHTAISLGETPISIPSRKQINWNKSLNIKKPFYDNYKNSYIKNPGTPEKNSWEIFSDYIDNIKE